MDRFILPGADTAAGIRHAGGDAALYKRFLARFPQDETFSSLGKALAAHRTQDAFFHAHTLKGLTAQLGITALSEPASAICDLLRPRCDEALEQAALIYDAMRPMYARITQAILAL